MKILGHKPESVTGHLGAGMMNRWVKWHGGSVGIQQHGFQSTDTGLPTIATKYQPCQ